MFLVKEDSKEDKAKEKELWKLCIEAYEETEEKSDSPHHKTYLEIMGITDPVHSSVLGQNHHLDNP